MGTDQRRQEGRFGRVSRKTGLPMLFVCVLIAGMLGSVVVQAGTAAATPTRNPESVGSSGGTGELFGVAATPRGDAWAVGYSGTTPDTKTLTLYWNGSGWKPMSSPSPPSAVLYGVAATSLTNAWAVGYSGDYPNTKTLILHRNGKTWRQMPSTAGTLSGVVATSPTNAWAVGSTNSVDTLILHWNGKTWRQMPSPNPGIGQGLSSFLSGVAVSSGGTIWAVGNGNNCGCGPGESLIERWNGNTWGQVPTPTFGGGINLFAVASLHSGRSWAVGLSGSGDGPTSGVILQWTGTAWTRVPIPDLRSDDGGLFGLAATSRSNAWAVGWDSAGGSPAGTPKIVILHWNGSTWKTLTIAGSANTPAGGAVSTTTTTTLAPTTTTLAPTATTTVPAGAFAPFAGTWGAHEETLVIDSNGTGTLNYADLTLCPSCSMASAPQGTIEFVLTSVTNGEGMGSVTASSDPSNGAIGAPVEVSLTAASPGQFLDVVIGGQQFINFCNSSSVGQCGA